MQNGVTDTFAELMAPTPSCHVLLIAGLWWGVKADSLLCWLEFGAEYPAPHDPMPVVVAQDALENQSSEHSVKQARGDDEEPLHGTRRHGHSGDKPVVQVEFETAQRDYYGGNAALDAALCPATELAGGKPDGTTEVEQIAQTQADG